MEDSFFNLKNLENLKLSFGLYVDSLSLLKFKNLFQNLKNLKKLEITLGNKLSDLSELNFLNDLSKLTYLGLNLRGPLINDLT